jgi:hypothetical protein
MHASHSMQFLTDSMILVENLRPGPNLMQVGDDAIEPGWGDVWKREIFKKNPFAQYLAHTSQ